MLGCANQEAPTNQARDDKLLNIYSTFNPEQKTTQTVGIPSLYRYMFNIRFRVPQYEAELDDFISYH